MPYNAVAFKNWMTNPDVRARRNEYLRQWCKANPEKRYMRYFRARLKKYGFTPESYHRLLIEQNFNCAACGQPLELPTAEKRERNGNSVVIDHNHETGEFRGLVHNDCNRAIGLFQDNPEILRKAAAYLETAKKK